MSRGCFFLVVSHMFFYIANTFVLYFFSHTALLFLFSLFLSFTCQSHTYLQCSGNFLTGIHISLLSNCRPSVEWLKNRCKSVADCITYLSLLSFWPLDPNSLCLKGKAKCLFHSSPAFQDSVTLSQLKKRHEINVMSMAFSHETPKALSQSHLA